MKETPLDGVQLAGLRLPFAEVLVLVFQVGAAVSLFGVIVGAVLYLLGVRPCA